MVHHPVTLHFQWRNKVSAIVRTAMRLCICLVQALQVLFVYGPASADSGHAVFLPSVMLPPNPIVVLSTARNGPTTQLYLIGTVLNTGRYAIQNPIIVAKLRNNLTGDISTVTCTTLLSYTFPGQRNLVDQGTFLDYAGNELVSAESVSTTQVITPAFAPLEVSADYINFTSAQFTVTNKSTFSVSNIVLAYRADLHLGAEVTIIETHLQPLQTFVFTRSYGIVGSPGGGYVPEPIQTIAYGSIAGSP